MTRTFFIAIVLASCGTVLADDEHHEPRRGVLRDGFYAAPLFTYTKTDEDRGTGNGYGWNLALGYQIDDGWAACEVNGFYTRLRNAPYATSEKLRGATLNALVFPLSHTSFLPNLYAIFGAGFQTEENKTLQYEVGGGYLLPIQMSESYSFAVRADARVRIDTEQPPKEGTNATSQFNDVVFAVGVQIPLSHEPPAAPPPPKPEVVPVPK